VQREKSSQHGSRCLLFKKTTKGSRAQKVWLDVAWGGWTSYQMLVKVMKNHTHKYSEWAW
jgi:hypothetical protein